jgi:hypothetical protein
MLSNPNGSMYKLVNQLMTPVQHQEEESPVGAPASDCDHDDHGITGTSNSATKHPSDDSSCCRSTLHHQKNKSRHDNDNVCFKLSKIASVEIQVYQQSGSGIEPHYGNVFFLPEQIEVVFTLEHPSDCTTKWKEE